MSRSEQIPVGVSLSTDIEYRPGRPRPYRARVRWVDPATRRRCSVSESVETEDQAEDWIDEIQKGARAGIDPATFTMTLAEYGESVMTLATRGLESKTLDPYMAGCRCRVVPSLGHLQVRMITNGALISHNPARVTGWQQQYKMAEDEMDDPRALALPDWGALVDLAAALVERSSGHFTGWGEVVNFAACTAARIGEVSGVRVGDIDRDTWTWKVRRQTTPSPGGLVDKGTKGKRARTVPLIEEIQPMVARRLDALGDKPAARLFTGPRGGRITTAVLRDATHWDDVVTGLGYEHLRRHDLRHTGLTWMADAGVPVHVLRKIAGHGSLSTTQRYLHPDAASISAAGKALSVHLKGRRSPDGPRLRAV